MCVCVCVCVYQCVFRSLRTFHLFHRAASWFQSFIGREKLDFPKIHLEIPICKQHANHFPCVWKQFFTYLIYMDVSR